MIRRLSPSPSPTSAHSSRGNAAEPSIAIAEALLNAKDDYSKEIIELLSRALSLMLERRSATLQLKTLADAMRILSSEHGLSLPRRTALLGEAEALALSIEDSALQVASAGPIADTWACREADRPRAQRLLELAQERLAKIEFPPDKIFAIARLIPALRNSILVRF